MIIDIKPTIEQTKDEVIRELMNLNGYKEMYVFRLENGNNYSRVFTPKNFEEFVPSRNVSEMIQSWEEGIKSRYEEAKKAYETGLHPTFTNIVYRTIPGTDIKTEEFDRVPRPLDNGSREAFKHQADNLKKEFGKITFYKIV